jgi:hypothetical protein
LKSGDDWDLLSYRVGKMALLCEAAAARLLVLVVVLGMGPELERRLKAACLDCAVLVTVLVLVFMVARLVLGIVFLEAEAEVEVAVEPAVVTSKAFLFDIWQ